MPWDLPEIEKCCGCVTDLKTAAAIIAVLGIVTSPAVAWAVVRHSHVVRVSCFMTTNALRPDVIDIHLSNVLSFGFGANAGLPPSCLGPSSDVKIPPRVIPHKYQTYIDSVKYVGWIVLFADLVFVFCSIYFLYKIFFGPDRLASTCFLYAASVSITFSFIYGLMYIVSCITVGDAIPIFEIAFCLFDALVWIYFLIVVMSYRDQRDLRSSSQ